MVNSFTPIQRKLLGILADGQPHTRKELLAALEDPTADRKILNGHMDRMRAKLRPAGHDIVCVLRCKAIHYRHVLILSQEE